MDIRQISVRDVATTADWHTILEPGQKVRITRMTTITYMVDIADYLENSGDEDVSVATLIEDQEHEMTISDIMDEMDSYSIEDETVVKVEIL